MVGGNLAIGAAELLAGRWDTLAVTADAVHNVGDAVTYHQQCQSVIEHHGLDRREHPEHLARRRRWSHTIICLGSAGVASAAIYELIDKVDHQTGWLAVGVAAASVAFNGFVSIKPLKNLRRSRKERKSTVYEKDIVKHLALVDMPSSVLALGGSLAQKYNLDIACLDTHQLAAIASGMIGAYAFRPTRRNLSHDHHQ